MLESLYKSIDNNFILILAQAKSNRQV